jgi:hypothetical protein
MIYDQRSQKEKPVKMQLTPEPKTMIASAKLHSTTGVPTLKDLVIHPKFSQPGNNFLVICDTNDQVQVCKAIFTPVETAQDKQDALLDLVKRLPHLGENLLDVTASADNGIYTCQATQD